MKSITDIDSMGKLHSKVIDMQLDLRCSRCGGRYDYYKFDNGQGERIGCDCFIIEKVEQSTSNCKAKQERLDIERVFRQPMLNDDLLKAHFDNYKPTSSDLLEAKQIMQKYAANFSLDNPTSLLLRGTYGIGKSYLAMSIVKEVKKKGYTALFIDVTELITAYRGTYTKASDVTEKQLDQLVRDVDLLVIDDYGTSLTNYGLSKMFNVASLRTRKHDIITTSNITRELTLTKDSKEILSRLMKSTQILKVHGADHRLKDSHS